MTPQEFIAKWKPVSLSERIACQQHFLALCELLGQPKPVDVDPTGQWYTFEKGVEKIEGGDGFADVWMRGHFGWEYKRKRRNLEEAYKQLLLYREALENPCLLIVCDMDRFEVHTNFPNTVKRVYAFDLDGLADPANLDVLRKAFTQPEALRPDLTPAKITEEAARQFADLADRLRMRAGDCPNFRPSENGTVPFAPKPEKGTGPIGRNGPAGAAHQSDQSPFPDPAQRIAHFLMRLMFCMFGEDIGLLPSKLFSRLLEQGKRNPAALTSRLQKLFAAMATGGDFGTEDIPWFNGGLFDDDSVIPLAPEEINMLAAVNEKDWSQVEPSIFGTLFVGTLDPSKRSQIGAHYTSRDDIETLVQPVVMAPLRREWAEVKRQCEEELWPAVVEASRAKTRRGAKPSAARNKFDRAIQDFVERLAHVSVLDPACGSGNFLYVSLHLLLDLEKEVITYAAQHGLSLVPHVHPRQLSGLEINPYAQQLASIVLWIGYLQWMYFNGFKPASRPVLEPIQSIRCQDAILDLGDPEHPKEPEWPEAEFIVGNPPFLGGKMLRRNLDDAYVDAMFAVWSDRVRREADLCCYWFEKARAQIALKKCRRAGLLATQGIRGGANRRVLERIKETGDIFFAESDRDWVLDGANVHVSMVGFDAGTEINRVLDAQGVSAINANLTHTANLGDAKPLGSNAALGFMGVTKQGPFEVLLEKVQDWLLTPNAHGRPNSDVLAPYLNGNDVTKRSRQSWLIDFPHRITHDEAASYQLPFECGKSHVKPFRESRARSWFRDQWWELYAPRPEMRRAMVGLSRYLATPRVAKYRLFVWVDRVVLPDCQIIAFARDDDYFFGVLQSRVHEVWALRQGTRLETRPRYTPTTCFETFPFPFVLGGAADGVKLRPTESAQRRTEFHSVQNDPRRTEFHSVQTERPGVQDGVELRPTGKDAACAAIAAAARELDELRTRWLNPPEWTKTEILEFPGSADGPWARYIDPATIARRTQLPLRLSERGGATPSQNAMDAAEAASYAVGTVRWPRIVPKDADCAESLKKRTLTNLYNQRPAWLDLAHQKLDAAVFAAYGWDPGISDEELLAKLLALNIERAREAQT